jgi:hypothetical protein
VGRANRKHEDEWDDESGSEDTGGHETTDVKEALRALRERSGGEADDIAALIAAVEGRGHLGSIVNSRLNAYRSIVEFDRTGAIAGHATSADQALLELNELRNGALRFDVARAASGAYMHRFPEAKEKLGRADALLSGPGKGGGRWRDDTDADVQIIPKEGAETTVVAFCDFRQRFNMPVNTLYHVWLSHLPANVVILRDWERMLYLQGVASLGSVDDSVEKLKEMLALLKTRKTVTIGNSAGGFGALHYGALLGADASVVFAPPVNIPHTVENLRKRARLRNALVEKRDEGAIQWPDLKVMYSENPNLRAHIFYGELNDLDRTHAESMAGVDNVKLTMIEGATSHGLLGMVAEEGLLEDALYDAVLRQAGAENLRRTPR